MASVSPSAIERILRFVAVDLFILLSKHNFRIVNSQVEPGIACVNLASGNVVVNVYYDKGIFHVALRAQSESVYRQHSIDIIRRLLKPRLNQEVNSLMTPENGAFLCAAAPKLNMLFEKGIVKHTLKKIGELEKERYKAWSAKRKAERKVQ